MRLYLLCLFSGALALSSGQASAQDQVFPEGYKFTYSYLLSDTIIPLGDTIIASCELVNQEAFSISGLYFSGTLPPSLAVVSETASINDLAVPLLREGPLLNNTIVGYSTYRWIIDAPGSASSRTINPGDRVQLRYRIVSSDIGRFSLPLHACTWYGNAQAFFATSTGDTVGVVISVSVDDSPDGFLPHSALVAWAYPNPFNAEVTIAFNNVTPGSDALRFEIFDILGRQIERRLVRPEGSAGTIRWQPPQSVNSGVFLYRLSDARHSTNGKLLLLK